MFRKMGVSRLRWIDIVLLLSLVGGFVGQTRAGDSYSCTKTYTSTTCRDGGKDCTDSSEASCDGYCWDSYYDEYCPVEYTGTALSRRRTFRVLTGCRLFGRTCRLVLRNLRLLLDLLLAHRDVRGHMLLRWGSKTVRWILRRHKLGQLQLRRLRQAMPIWHVGGQRMPAFLGFSSAHLSICRPQSAKTEDVNATAERVAAIGASICSLIRITAGLVVPLAPRERL